MRTNTKLKLRKQIHLIASMITSIKRRTFVMIIAARKETFTPALVNSLLI